MYTNKQKKRTLFILYCGSIRVIQGSKDLYHPNIALYNPNITLYIHIPPYKSHKMNKRLYIWIN